MTRSNISLKDRDILRRLGAELAEAAADPLNDTRREIHRRVDRMEPGQPSIMFYQEPWNELNVGGELDPRCEAEFLRGIERGPRMTLYKWRNHPGDMVVDAAVNVARCVQDTGFGIAEDVDIVRTDADSDVVSRHFHIQIRDETDIRFPVLERRAVEDGPQKVWRVQPSELPLRDPERLPDDGRRVLDLLVPPSGVGSQAHRRER